MSRPTVVLLDAGNTIVFLDHDALAQAAPEGAGRVTGELLARTEPVAKKRYEAAMARGLSHEAGWELYVHTIFELAGLAHAQAHEAMLRARRMHDALNLWRKVPAELPAALERAQAKGLRFGIVSNSEGQLLALLQHVGLAHYFEHVVDSALEGVRKPDPEIFRRTLARMKVAPSEALYAGDIPHVDVDGARAAGLDAVLIDTLAHYPDYRDAPRYASVAELLEQL